MKSEDLCLSLLPRQGQNIIYIGLQAVEFTLDDHALLGAITVSFLYHHMDIDAGAFLIRARYMELPARLGKTLIKDAGLHISLYTDRLRAAQG